MKRSIGPIAASKPTATTMSIPGIVISRFVSALASASREFTLENPKILGQSIILAQVSFDRCDLVIRKQRGQQPGATLQACNVRVRTLRHEVSMKIASIIVFRRRR